VRLGGLDHSVAQSSEVSTQSSVARAPRTNLIELRDNPHITIITIQEQPLHLMVSCRTIHE
jgi:hypothetical protein